MPFSTTRQEHSAKRDCTNTSRPLATAGSNMSRSSSLRTLSRDNPGTRWNAFGIASNKSSVGKKSSFATKRHALNNRNASSSKRCCALPMVRNVLCLISRRPPTRSMTSPKRFIAMPLTVKSRRNTSSSKVSA